MNDCSPRQHALSFPLAQKWRMTQPHYLFTPPTPGNAPEENATRGLRARGRLPKKWHTFLPFVPGDLDL